MLSICRGQQLKEEEKIEVDKLKNVPSFAIFYWFLFWLSRLLACRLTLDDSKWKLFSVALRAIVAVDEAFASRSLNVYGFTSVDASDENNFTTFLCCAGEIEDRNERKDWNCIGGDFL